MVTCYARGREHSPNHATRSFVPTGTEESLEHLPSTEVLGYFLPSLSGLRQSAPCGASMVWVSLVATPSLARNEYVYTSWRSQE